MSAEKLWISEGQWGEREKKTMSESKRERKNMQTIQNVIEIKHRLQSSEKCKFSETRKLETATDLLDKDSV